MKIFANKNIWKKIVLILLMLTFFNFIEPIPVNAGIGGDLMEPICDLFIGIGDGVVNIIHQHVLKQPMSLISVNLKEDFLTQLGRWIITIVIVVIVAACIFAVFATTTFGVFALLHMLPISLGVMAKTGTIVALSLIGGGFVGYKVFNSNSFTELIDIPVYSISPEEIFKNEIPLFDVNFFDTNGKSLKYANPNLLSEMDITYDRLMYYRMGTTIERAKEDANEYLVSLGFPENFNIDYIIENSDQNIVGPNSSEDMMGVQEYKNYYLIVEKNNSGNEILKKGLYRLEYFKKWDIDQYNYIYNLYYADVSIDEMNEYMEIAPYKSELREVVSIWYYRLLVFAIIGMMSVLVYIGIRILLSSTSASQKAKYKQMLGDWFIGMILLFSMHYIMTFANLFVDKLTGILTNINPNMDYRILTLNDGDADKLEKALTKSGFSILEVSEDSQENIKDYGYETVFKFKIDEDGEQKIAYQIMAPNLMAKLRFELRANRNTTETYIGYTIMFCVMVVYLCIYIFTYVRRLVYMVFLTMIAPLVALTYPIDKVNDGKAQGYNFWFKEYIFNLLIQPLHLLLYTILISSAMKLIIENMIYALVIIGFMTPAEKLMRKMFNFEKASTPGIFGGAAGGALIMSGMRWLMGHGPHGKEERGGKEGLQRDADGKIISSSGANTLKLKKGNMSPDTTSQGGGSAPTSGNNAPYNRRRNNSQNTEDATARDRARWQGQEGDASDNNGEDGGMVRIEDGESGATDTGSQTGDNGSGDGDGATDNGTQPSSNIDNNIDDDIQLDESIFNSDDNSDSTSEVEGNLWESLKAASSVYAKKKISNVAKSIADGKPIRFVGRTAARIAGATTLGMAGLIAGIPTGSPEKIMQFTLAGVAGGGKLGAGTFNAVSGHLGGEDSKEASEAAKRAYRGEKEYQKKIAEQNQRNAMYNEENIKKLQEKLKISRKEAQERLKKAIPYYFDNKITDMDTIAKMEKVVYKDEQKIKANNTLSDAQKAVRLANARRNAHLGYHFEDQYKISSRPGREKRNAIREQIMRDYGWDEAKAESIMRLADKYNRVQNNA